MNTLISPSTLWASTKKLLSGLGLYLALGFTMLLALPFKQQPLFWLLWIGASISGLVTLIACNTLRKWCARKDLISVPKIPLLKRLATCVALYVVFLIISRLMAVESNDITPGFSDDRLWVYLIASMTCFVLAVCILILFVWTVFQLGFSKPVHVADDIQEPVLRSSTAERLNEFTSHELALLNDVRSFGSKHPGEAKAPQWADAYETFPTIFNKLDLTPEQCRVLIERAFTTFMQVLATSYDDSSAATAPLDEQARALKDDLEFGMSRHIQLRGAYWYGFNHRHPGIFEGFSRPSKLIHHTVMQQLFFNLHRVWLFLHEDDSGHPRALPLSSDVEHPSLESQCHGQHRSTQGG